MERTVIDIFLYLFEAIVFIFYCENAFKPQLNKALRYLIVFISYSALFGIYKVGINYLNGIAMLIIYFALMLFVYKAKTISALIQSILYIAFMIAGEYLVYPLANILFDLKDVDAHNNLHSYLFAVITSKVIHFICIMVMLFFVNKNKQKKIKDSKGFALILTIPISNIVVLVFIEYISKQLSYDLTANVLWGLIAVFMLMTNFMVFYNRAFLIKQSSKIHELSLENQKQKLDEQYFSVIEKKNEDMQVLAHDFKNHLATIRNLDLPEEANEYIDSIYPEIEKINQIGISKNKTLDLIISKYVSLCEIKDIIFSIDVKTANLSFIESQDLTALLTNLLDNAVEAAAQSKEKKISLVIEKQNEFLEKLTVANSCDSAPQENAGKPLSRKADKEAHGFGTKSIRKIAEKYGGIYDWQYDEKTQIFTTSILFPKE